MNKTLGEIQALRERLLRDISNEASSKLRALLEGKHIYQSVLIDGERLISEWKAGVENLGATVTESDLGFAQQRFVLSESQINAVDRVGGASSILTLIVGNIKLFCSTCKERETFSPVWFRDMANELTEPVFFVTEATAPPPPDGFQLFYITLECQHCQGKPEGMMVRRQGWRLSLDGRSPMEYVIVPPHIPKNERTYYRDAIIAGHGGKILAGLFYLRTLIEIFARRATGETGKRHGDELMDEYYKILPEAYRDLMPSLKQWYGKLSEPIHTGKDDGPLFDEAREAIERHFEMRRLFKIAEQ